MPLEIGLIRLNKGDELRLKQALPHDAVIVTTVKAVEDYVAKVTNTYLLGGMIPYWREQRKYNPGDFVDQEIPNVGKINLVRE